MTTQSISELMSNANQVNTLRYLFKHLPLPDHLYSAVCAVSTALLECRETNGAHLINHLYDLG